MTETMAIYYLVFLTLLFFSVTLPYGQFLPLSIKTTNVTNLEKIFTWNFKTALLLILIGLISGFRDVKIGTDFSGYVEFYEYILNNHEFKYGKFLGTEFGYNYLNLWAAKINVPYPLFFASVTMFTWYFFIKGSYKYQHLLPLMFFFIITSGFFFWTLSGLRQSISIMIFFYSIKFIIERDFYKYIIYILIGSLFHNSLLIMLPVYFLVYVSYKRTYAFILFSVSLIFIGTNFFTLINEQLVKLLSGIDSLSAYLYYLDKEEYLNPVKMTGTNLGFLLKTIFTFWIILKSKKILKKHEELKIYYLLFLIFAIATNLFFGIELIGRVLNYFYVSFAIVAAATIYYAETYKDKIISLIFLTVFTLLYFVSTFKFLSSALG